jgi:hypothetical protein
MVASTPARVPSKQKSTIGSIDIHANISDLTPNTKHCQRAQM